METTCYLVERLGPYHYARLDQVAGQFECKLHVLELAPYDETYSWKVTVVTEQRAFTRSSLLKNFLANDLQRALNEIRPSVVFLNGWAHRGALLGLEWCLYNGTPTVVMSDSQEHDEPRRGWKEWLKRRFVRRCQAAFVAGQRHVSYIVNLGMPAEQIVMGYDVVDNDYFQSGVAVARTEPELWCERLGLPANRKFFLCVSRFVSKKNLPLLLRAYTAYLNKQSFACRADDDIWDIMFVGDGEERSKLEIQIDQNGLRDRVHLLGFRQYDELPACYGIANALILASTTDQWGLAVNEGMASGLPVLVSDACGCAPDLVQQGINGYTFDPRDEHALTDLMVLISSSSADTLRVMGEASQRLIADWSLKRFSDGLRTAARLAIECSGCQNGRNGSKLDRALFRAIAHFR
jgi:glycosyltransferase involved in cell wall biosynthesis